MTLFAELSQGTIILLVLAGIAVLLFFYFIAAYNGLVNLRNRFKNAFAQIDVQLKRRYDLIPNLVETVKGAAAFEQSTLVAVTEARSKVGQLSAGAAQNLANDPAAFQKFQEAQDGLSSALSRLMVVVEKYPELKANQNFLNLQSQLESTENGIANERRRFNEAAQTFNTKRQSFPTNIVAGFFGARFNEKPYFKAAEGSDKAPPVKF